MKQTGVVILAAGLGKRFGHDKRLAAVGPQAEPMLLATIRSVRASGMPFIVVLRPGDHTWQQELDSMEIDWVTSPEAHLGMGHSLAAGVHATQHWDGWLIALADMPYIQPATYQRIAAALQQNKIVRPTLLCPTSGQPQHGHPVGFSRSYAWALAQCQGDEGARRLLADNPNDVYLLPLGDEGIVQDIDRPGDC